jgi:hypothetical protein
MPRSAIWWSVSRTARVRLRGLREPALGGGFSLLTALAGFRGGGGGGPVRGASRKRRPDAKDSAGSLHVEGCVGLPASSKAAYWRRMARRSRSSERRARRMAERLCAGLVATFGCLSQGLDLISDSTGATNNLQAEQVGQRG